MKTILHSFRFFAIFLISFCLPGLIYTSFSQIQQNPFKTLGNGKAKEIQVNDVKMSNIAKILSDKLACMVNRNNKYIDKKFDPSLLSGKNTGLLNFQNLKANNTPNLNLTVVRNEKNGTPRFITGERLKQKTKNIGDNILSTEVAINYIQNNKDLFSLDNPVNELRLKSENPDPEGNRHILYEQFYNDVPVWGKEIAVHLDNQKQIYLINSAYSPTPNNIDVNSGIISSETALQTAVNDLSNFDIIETISPDMQRLLNYTNPIPKKYIYIRDSDSKPFLAWVVEIRPNIAECWRYFIDASTGTILEKYNASPSDGPTTTNATDEHGNKRQINVFQQSDGYYMADASRPMYNNSDPNNPKGLIVTYNNNNTDLNNQASPYVFTSQNNTWTDPASVSVHYNMGLTYEYYRQTHNRNSLDGNGMTIFSIIHVTNNNQSFDNAYWNGSFVVMGDGGQYCNPWPGSLDLLAHEMTHGVITFTVDLEYKTQSGALNEGFADWGGAMVDRGNWKIGEEIAKTSFFPTGCVRDMENPHNGGTPGDLMIYLPANMSEYANLDVSQDNGGVHVNCGIINKATSLIGNAITKDKLEKIYYRLLNNKYLTKQSQFIDLRLAAIQSAKELYGDNSTEMNAVKSAFDQVGIKGNEGTSPNPDLPSVKGQQYVAAVSASDYSLYMAKSVVVNANTDIKQLTSTQLYTYSGSVVTVPDNGSFLLFIDSQNNLKSIYSDGTNEVYVDQQGIWRSVSISPDGNYIAATLVNEQPEIYIFDIPNSSYKKYQLYVPTTAQTDYKESPYAADVLSWNVNGKVLVYDALNYKISQSGDFTGYWDMNLLDPATGTIYRVFPPLQQGINLGKPSFSQTSENVLTFEIYDTSADTYLVAAANIFTGESNPIVQSDGQTSTILNPCYSTDDKKIVYQVYSNADAKYYIYKSNLDNSKIKSTNEDPVQYLTNAALPRWFAIGSRPVNVEDQLVIGNSAIKVYPNPATSMVNIDYSLASNKPVEMALYNTLSQPVKDLMNIPVNETGNGTMSVDCSDLSSGMYYVLIRLADGSKLTEKVMIAK